MHVKDMRKLTQGELADKLAGFRKELMNLRFQHTTSQLENTAKLPQVKGDIARLMTVLKERELSQEKGE